MTSKSFFNSKEISDAIIAAAKSTEEFSKENQPVKNGDEEESSFLHRLHQNSQLLSNENDVNKKEKESKGEMGEEIAALDGLFLTTSSNNKCIDNEGDNRSSPAESKQVVIQFPANILTKLDELFGDEQQKKGGEQEEDSSPPSIVEVSLPIWLCELLYKACRKIPIDDINISKIEEANVTNKTPNKRRGAGGGGRKAGADFNIGIQKISSSLRMLYETFPNIPEKTIKQCAKENKYDYNQTADHLLTVMEHAETAGRDDLFSIGSDSGSGDGRPPDSEEQPLMSYIVRSHHPHVITEEQQQRDSPPPALPPPLMGLAEEAEEWSATGMDEMVAEMTREIAQIELQQRHYVEMAKQNYSDLRQGALRQHYSMKAKSLRAEKDWLERQYDRIRVWNGRDSDSIDLHSLSVERAIEAVKYKIDCCRTKHPNLRKLYAITGHGRTTGQPSVIRARLVQFLKQHAIDHQISPNNVGVVEIRLGGIHQRLCE